ncbi:choice-of-anchor D domain-containing protein [Streptomyces sp. NPDC051985]|uniref:choice-of-anchor D domain-containing protein n=1 Tax=Streptomyces sp. NPDC051985 TaxID=3155807 RepID=UPI00342DC1C8
MNSVVFGNLGVTLTDRHGARVTRLPLRPPGPELVRLPHGPEVGPPPFLVGRTHELDLVRTAVSRRGAVEFSGPCGSGRTTLLRNAAALGGTYTRVGRTELEDLLQDLMRRFYVYPGPDGTRLSTQECAQALGHVQGVVVLDDVPYGPPHLEYLRLVLPGCALVTGTGTPALGALGTPYPLPGLSEPAALALLSRELGRYLPEPEQAAVRRLVAAVGGQPLALRQAAALVRFDGHTFADLATRAAADPGVLDELSISAVGPRAKRVLAVLTLVGGVLLPAGLLGQMADIAYVAETLESLSSRGLAERREDRFGLPVCKSEPYRRILYSSLGLASAVRALAAWLASGDPTGEDARGAAEAALGLLGIAAERREWQTVVEIVTVLERVLFVQGHWQAWQQTLAQGITAAQAVGDRAAEAYFAHQQGVQHFLHDRTEHARRLLRRALDLRTELGDTAGAAVTAANLALLEPAPSPPSPPRPSGTRQPWQRALIAAAAVVAVLVAGTVIGRTLGGSGGGSDDAGSSPVASAGGGTGGGAVDGGTTGSAADGGTTVGGTDTGTSVGTSNGTSVGTSVGTNSGTSIGTSVGTSRGTSVGQTTNGNGGSPLLLGPVVSPASYDFGQVNISPVSDTPEHDITVTNPNSQAIDLGAVTLPADSGFSAVTGTCGSRLEAGASCTETVRFRPSRLGAASARLTVASGGKSYPADLTGTGKALLTIGFTGASDRTVRIEDGQGTVLCEVRDDSEGATAGPAPCKVTVTDPQTQLTASISDPGFRFLGWSGDVCTGDNPCVPVLDQNAEETVTFAASKPR